MPADPEVPTPPAVPTTEAPAAAGTAPAVEPATGDINKILTDNAFAKDSQSNHVDAAFNTFGEVGANMSADMKASILSAPEIKMEDIIAPVRTGPAEPGTPWTTAPTRSVDIPYRSPSTVEPVEPFFSKSAFERIKEGSGIDLSTLLGEGNIARTEAALTESHAAEAAADQAALAELRKPAMQRVLTELAKAATNSVTQSFDAKPNNIAEYQAKQAANADRPVTPPVATDSTTTQ